MKGFLLGALCGGVLVVFLLFAFFSYSSKVPETVQGGEIATPHHEKTGFVKFSPGDFRAVQEHFPQMSDWFVPAVEDIFSCQRCDVEDSGKSSRYFSEAGLQRFKQKMAQTENRIRQSGRNVSQKAADIGPLIMTNEEELDGKIYWVIQQDISVSYFSSDNESKQSEEKLYQVKLLFNWNPSYPEAEPPFLIEDIDWKEVENIYKK